jgi:hypothetical protein
MMRTELIMTSGSSWVWPYTVLARIGQRIFGTSGVNRVENTIPENNLKLGRAFT